MYRLYIFTTMRGRKYMSNYLREIPKELQIFQPVFKGPREICVKK